MTYRNCIIERKWKGNTQPDTFLWAHQDYDGPEDKRCGFAKTLEKVLEDIDFCLDET